MKAALAFVCAGWMWLLPVAAPSGPLACPIPSPEAIAKKAGAGDVSYCATYLCLVAEASDEVKELHRMGVGYCEHFGRDVRPALTDQGKRWLDDVTACLMRDTQQALAHDPKASASVDDFFIFTAASHASCYIDAGICALPAADKATLMMTLKRPSAAFVGLMWPSTPALSGAIVQLGWACATS